MKPDKTKQKSNNQKWAISWNLYWKYQLCSTNLNYTNKPFWKPKQCELLSNLICILIGEN